MHALLAALVVVSMWSATVPQNRPARRGAEEVVYIDGAKNPEMIPAWSAWEGALSVLAKGPGELPSELIAHFTEGEAALVLKAAEAQTKREADYHDRVKRLFPLNGKEPKAKIEEMSREIAIDYRWQVLRARDRLLATLNPAAQSALAAWVESTKQGTTISILRRDLPFFLQPQ